MFCIGLHTSSGQNGHALDTIARINWKFRCLTSLLTVSSCSKCDIKVSGRRPKCDPRRAGERVMPGGGALGGDLQ